MFLPLPFMPHGLFCRQWEGSPVAIKGVIVVIFDCWRYMNHGPSTVDASLGFRGSANERSTNKGVQPKREQFQQSNFGVLQIADFPLNTNLQRQTLHRHNVAVPVGELSLARVQLDCRSSGRTRIINLPTNQKGYNTFETTVGKLSARRIQFFPVYFCLGILLKVILNNFQNNA